MSVPLAPRQRTALSAGIDLPSHRTGEATRRPSEACRALWVIIVPGGRYTLAGLSVDLPGAGGVTGNDESALANTQVHYLSSWHVGDEFRIIVGGCEDAPAGVGVLVVLDAFFNFGTAPGAAARDSRYSSTCAVGKASVADRRYEAAGAL